MVALTVCLMYTLSWQSVRTLSVNSVILSILLLIVIGGIWTLASCARHAHLSCCQMYWFLKGHLLYRFGSPAFWMFSLGATHLIGIFFSFSRPLFSTPHLRLSRRIRINNLLPLKFFTTFRTRAVVIIRVDRPSQASEVYLIGVNRQCQWCYLLSGGSQCLFYSIWRIGTQATPKCFSYSLLRNTATTTPIFIFGLWTHCGFLWTCRRANPRRPHHRANQNELILVWPCTVLQQYFFWGNSFSTCIVAD